MSFASRRNYAGVTSGQDTVSTAGTPVQLNSGTRLVVPQGAMLRVRANEGLTGNVYVGGSGVSASSGFALTGGEVVGLAVDDVSVVWVDSDNADQGVSWIVETDD